MNGNDASLSLRFAGLVARSQPDGAAISVAGRVGAEAIPDLLAGMHSASDLCQLLRLLRALSVQSAVRSTEVPS